MVQKRGISTVVSAILFGVSVLIFSFSFNLKAEGTREMSLSGGDRAYTEFRTATTLGIARRTDLFVYAEAGESLLLGSSAVGLGSGVINYTAPDGTSGTCGTAGNIADRAAEALGPDTLFVGGYTPCTVVVGAGQTGIWQIDMVSPNVGSNTNPAALGATAYWSQPNNVGYVSAWDITVTNAGVEQTGRAYTTMFAGNTGTFSSEFSAEFFVQTEDGYTFRVDANGMEPFGFLFFANNKGFRDGSGDPIYLSVTSGSIDVQDPHDPDSGTDITQKLFFNSPDATLPTSAALSPTTSTWLLNPVLTNPVVTNLEFVGSEGTPGQTGVDAGGSFTFDINSTSSFSLIIDINDNGSFTDPIDRELIGVSSPGSNSVPWDGLDGLGGTVPPAVGGGVTTFNIQFTTRVGEVHFPYIDVERNDNGIIIERLNGTGSPEFGVSWDDTNFGGGTSGTDADSSGGAHDFTSNFGNNRGIDTWDLIPQTALSLTADLTVLEGDLLVTNIAFLTAVPETGMPTTLTFTIRNDGPSDVVDADVTTFLPGHITNGQVISIVPSAGASSAGGGFSGSDFVDTVDLVSGATIVYTIQFIPNIQGPLDARATILRPADVFDAEATDPNSGVPADIDSECLAAGFPGTCNNIQAAQIDVLEGIFVTNPAVGGDPPIWENILVFPTPEKFEGRDLNSDGDLNDTILRYQNLESGQIFSTGISVSQNHRDIDIYGDNIVFVSRNDSLLSAIRRWFNPSGEIGVYNIKTKQAKMLNVWGDRPSIYQNTISISGSEIRFYDLSTSQLTEVGISAHNQAVWGEWIAYKAADSTICLYSISSGEIVKTDAEGEFPTIHEHIVAFEKNEQLYYYDIESAEVTYTGYEGEDAVIYGDRIVYSNNNKIYYYDIAQQQAFSTGKSGLEPDIFEDVITYYVWENWSGFDVNVDGDRQDPIVNTFTISDSDTPLQAAIDEAEVATAAIHSIQGSRDSQGVIFNVSGAGIESAQLEVYSLSGRVVFDSGFVNGNQLRWNLKRQDGAVLANGVYLFRMLVRGSSGKVESSEVRKLMVLR